jgi:hypothetical protein
LPSIVTYRAPEEYNLKGTSPLPFYVNEYVTFGTFARYEKMNDACLRMFAEVLKAVPESRLMFKDHAYRRPYSIRRVIDKMATPCETCNGAGEHERSTAFGKRCETCKGDGWIKDGDYNSTFSKTVLPLPYHARREYNTPPGKLEDELPYHQHHEDWQTYHTRYVTPDVFKNALRDQTGK